MAMKAGESHVQNARRDTQSGSNVVCNRHRVENIIYLGIPVVLLMMVRFVSYSTATNQFLFQTGVLSYTLLNHHEDARALRKAMENLAVNI